MKIAELQTLEAIANDKRNYSHKEKEAAKEQIAAAKVTGSIYVPVWFGSGADCPEEAAVLLKMARNIKISVARKALRDGRVNGGYAERDLAEAVGKSKIGMGSVTNYAVCESDPEAAGDCDISAIKGKGWRRAA